MPRNAQSIGTYVQRLLGSLTPVRDEAQYIAYGYPEERRVYEDPCLVGKQVVVVKSQYIHGKLITGQPNVIQEALNYINNMVSAAESLIDNDSKGHKDNRKATVDQLAIRCKGLIAANIKRGEAAADLFLSKDSARNKSFLKQLAEAKKHLRLFSQAVALASTHQLKVLEHEGHILRSHHRAALVHCFKTFHTTAGEGQFVMYIPCGRYTERQQQLMGKQVSVDRDHDTTSHNRSDLVLGNSNLVRMIAGTRHRDGTVTIHHDSFSGPGARMPYSDFKNADKYKKLAIKAITLINQEEIIQTLAQRQFDRSIAGLSEGPLHAEEERARSNAISAHFRDHPLSVTECYSQVVTAGQRISADHQREQFEYVRQAMDAFDGADVRVSIQTGANTEVALSVRYQARMSSWGVNWFRHVGLLNPLSNNRLTKDQNTRFMNQMTDDAVAFLGYTGPSLPAHCPLGPLMVLLQGPDVSLQRGEIARNEASLLERKALYRQALFAYFEEYHKGLRAWSKSELDRLKQVVDAHEQAIQTVESRIYLCHRQIEVIRKEYYVAQKEAIHTALESLRFVISPITLAADTDPMTRALLQRVYNSCAYLIDAQALYYSNTWSKDEHNFKLQTVMASLAMELDYASTKGCKSNNDRGQRLAQKIIGNALWTALSPDGLYTGEFLNQRRTHGNGPSEVERLDRELTTIQALHHTANMGVSGGKFQIQNKANFADNGLWGKIAHLAKIKTMSPTPAFKKNRGLKLGIGIFAALILGILTAALPPISLAIQGAFHASLGLSVGILSGLALVGTYLVGSLWDAIRNRMELSNARKSITAEVPPAETSKLQTTAIVSQLLVEAYKHPHRSIPRAGAAGAVTTPRRSSRSSITALTLGEGDCAPPRRNSPRAVIPGVRPRALGQEEDIKASDHSRTLT